MSSYSTYLTTTASPFSKAVVSSMRKLYPEELADKSFDNTGLLLEAPFDPIRRQMNSVLLTVDLTKAVTDEAIDGNHCVVVAYHPIIFHGLKSLNLANSQQQSLLRLALEGISVYCPHTAVDAVPGGMTDWLCDIVTGHLSADPEPATKTAEEQPEPLPVEESSEPSPDKPKRPSALQRAYSRPTYPQPQVAPSTPLDPDSTSHTRTVLHPSSVADSFPNDEFTSSNTGAGRLVTFSTPQPLTHLIERIARGVGTPKGFPVAIPQDRQVEDLMIKTVGICPGSGGSILGSCNADLLFTGELSHHEALAATERGAAVVSLFHSNSERGYLHSVMKEKLKKGLAKEWEERRQKLLERLGEGGKEGDESEADGEEVDEEWEDALKDENVDVVVSERDRDPYGIVILQGSEVEGTNLSGEKE